VSQSYHLVTVNTSQLLLVTRIFSDFATQEVSSPGSTYCTRVGTKVAPPQATGNFAPSQVQRVIVVVLADIAESMFATALSDTQNF
jgi:hypothetical protein